MRDADFVAALLKLLFAVLGLIGLAVHWPVWVCVVLLAAAGIWVFIDCGGDLDFW